MQLKSFLKQPTVIAALAFAASLLVLGSPYAVAQLRYRLIPHDRVTENADVKAPSATPETDAADFLWIPSLGVQAPIQYIDDKNETAYQAALKNGVVHFPDTAMPGQPGNVYIFGHSSDFVWSDGHYKTVFAVLPKIAVGADIKITDHDGIVYHYTVTGTKVVSPSNTSVLDQGDGSQSLLTLQTSYPVGTALQRFIVTAELH